MCVKANVCMGKITVILVEKKRARFEAEKIVFTIQIENKYSNAVVWL